MVSNVSMGSVNPNNVEFAKKAIKYVQGQKIEKESTGEEIVSSLPSSAAFASAYTIVPTAKSLIKNRKIASNLSENLNIAAGTVKETETELLGRIATQAAQKTKNKASKGLGKLLSKFSKKTVEEKAAKAGENAIKKATSKTAELATKTTARTFAKGVMGEAKRFAIFNMILELPEIIPAFKNGGIKEGVKQLGKSAINAGADAVGYAAGMKLGAMAGTAIGGPVGTIVGGAIGMVLGGLASHIIGKGVEKVIGKSYNEKEAEKEEQAQAEAIANDPEAMNELKELVQLKIQQDAQTGKKKDLKQAQQMQEALEALPEAEYSDAADQVAFNSSNADRAVNNAVRLNEANQTTNPFAQNEAQFQPQQAQTEAPQQPVWVPRTVGEMTSGLYDQNGNIKNIQYVA